MILLRETRSRTAWVLATLVLHVLVGCATRRSSEPKADALPSGQSIAVPKPSTPPTGGPTIPSEKDRKAVAEFGITSPCVLHAGDSQAERQERTTASGRTELVVSTGSCSFNAECIREQGKDFSGDGDVELDCRDRSCSCSYRRWAPAERALSFSFHVTDICSTADMAERLIRDVCMAGLKSVETSERTDGRRDQ